MPRNITVTFSDGSKHVYNNAPDDITPDAVSARAAKDFGKEVASLDGGRPSQPAPRQARPKLSPRPATPNVQELARQRVKAGQQGGIGGWLMENVPGAKLAADVTAAAQSGLSRATFGLPERIAAGVNYLSGTGQGKSYSEQLAIEREVSNQQMGRSATGNVIGQLLGAIGGGGLASGAVRAGAARAAASSAPRIAKAGNVLQGLSTVRQGQTARNAGKILAGGAVGGAAQALGEGSDVTTGAVAGAAGAGILAGGAKGVSKLARNITRPYSRNTDKAMREIVKEAPAAIEARAAELTRRTGAPVPAVAALNDRDFRSVTENVLKRSPEAQEIGKRESGEYVRSFMDRMLGHVNRAGRTGDAQITSIGELAQLRRDTADDLMAPIANRTMDLSTIPLDDLERAMTRQIGGRIQGLAPRINEALRDLTPDDLNGLGLDASDIANARRLMSQYGFANPVQVTVREMDSLRRSLDAASKSSMASNPANAMAFRNAARAVRAHVQDNVPEYGQVVDTFAAQSRMLEGFEAAAAGKRVTDIADDTLRNNLRTQEGRIGMKAGELFRLREAATNRPTNAISLARDLGAEGRLTRPASMDPGAAQPGTVTENLGDRAAAELADSAQAETQVLGRVLDTERLNALTKSEEGSLDAETLVSAAFLGPALAETKARLLSRLYRALRPKGVSERVANTIAERLYSQDPAQTAEAFRALRRAGLDDTIVNGLVRGAVPVGMLASPSPSDPSMSVLPEAGADVPSVAADLGEEDGAPAAEADLAVQNADGSIGPDLEGLGAEDPAMDPEADPAAEMPYGQSVVAELFPDAVITDANRDPNSDLGRKNPGSYHVATENAVDVRPIPGMTFEEFVQTIEDAGHTIVEAIDEVKNPSGHATGPHWHVVIA